MTRHFLAPAALALAALAPGVAFAQYLPTNDNSVQIYGRLDMSVNAVKAESADRRTTVTSDTSLIGFPRHRTARRRHGGLLQARTRPEPRHRRADASGIAKRSSAWAASASATLEIGEHWGPGVWLTGRIDPFGRQQLGAAQTLLQTTANRGFNATYLNAVEYVSPDLAGVRARVR